MRTPEKEAGRRSSWAFPKEAGHPGLTLLGSATVTGDTFHAASTVTSPTRAVWEVTVATRKANFMSVSAPRQGTEMTRNQLR